MFLGGAGNLRWLRIEGSCRVPVWKSTGLFRVYAFGRRGAMLWVCRVAASRKNRVKSSSESESLVPHVAHHTIQGRVP